MYFEAINPNHLVPVLEEGVAGGRSARNGRRLGRW
jgi:hypothetical protein